MITFTKMVESADNNYLNVSVISVIPLSGYSESDRAVLLFCIIPAFIRHILMTGKAVKVSCF